MSPSKIFLVSCLSFGAGILAGELRFALLLLLILPVFPFVVKKRAPGALFLLGALLFSFSLGVLRLEGAMEKWKEGPLFVAAQEREQVSFAGLVAEEPEIRGGTYVLVLESGEGRVLARSQQEFSYGDAVLFEGILEPPPPIPGFDYAAFLAKEGIFAQSSSFSLRKTEGEQFHPWVQVRSFLLALKSRFSETLSSFVPEPEASLLAAILLGEKSGISEKTGEELSRSGLRHITAISGMHVALLASLVLPLLLRAGLGKRHASMGALALVLFFVAITGFQISAIRAGLMGSLAVFGALLGRRSSSIRALVFVGAALLFWNPLLLLHDLGFQLSFLAVLGMIMAAEPVLSFLRKVPEFMGMREILAMSIAAQLLPFPVLLLSFQEASSSSLLSNMLAVPVLPFILSVGFPFLLFGSFSSALGYALGYVEYLLMHWVLLVAEFFSLFPVFPSNSLVFLGYAVFLVFLLHFLWERRKRPSPWGPRPVDPFF